MGTCCAKNDTGAAQKADVVETVPVDSPSPGHALAFVNGNCCPYSAMLKILLHLKGVKYEEIVCEMGCQEEWLAKLSPDKTTPILAYLPTGSSNAKENLEPIRELVPESSEKSPTVLAMAQWLDKTYPKGPVLAPEHESLAEAESQTKELSNSIPMVCAAPKPPIQKEKRAIATAAMQKLDALLQKNGGKTLLGTEELTYVDCVLLGWLHRYPIMVHWRSWTPETKPGSVSEEAPPSVSESTLPALAAYREAAMQKYGHILPSKEALLAFGEKRIKRPSPMSAGRLQHQSFRWWMRESKKMLAELSSRPTDQALADKVATCWARYVEFMYQHSVMEDDVIYKVFEEVKPGCTQTSSSEHSHEMPLLRQSVETVKAMAGNSARTEEDVKAVLKEVEKLCESLEAHLVGEETHLFPILESMDMQKHYELFPNALRSCDQERPELFAFVLQGLNLSEQEQYWRNILDYGKLEKADIVAMHGYMRAHLDKGFLTEEKVTRLEARVAELRAIREEGPAMPNAVKN